MEFRKICIVGLGLIGGSLAKALRAKTNVEDIYAIDSDEMTLRQAQEDEVITQAVDYDSPLLRCADAVFVCTPVDKIIGCVTKLLGSVRNGCVICDTASTKTRIVDEVEQLPGNFIFVGGHPMAGSENSGYRAGNAHLFENAYFVLTPCDKSSDEAMDALFTLVKEMGAIPLTIDRKDHDRAVGVVSHLPHVVAASLVNLLAEEDGGSDLCSRLAAGGFRDLTRIASSDPQLWCSITQSNAASIAELIDSLTGKLNEFKKKLYDQKALYDYYNNAKSTRDRLSSRLNSLIPEVYELYVDVEDKPGMISLVASSIGDRGINIKNINISNNREETGGIMVVTLENEDQLYAARDALCEKGVRATVRSRE